LNTPMVYELSAVIPLNTPMIYELSAV
jgi:hypothetical protein